MPGDDSMLYWLAKACTAAREAAGRKQVHVGASADMDQSSVWRFEAGKAWPKNIDKLVNAYADDLDIEPFQLWQAATEMWAAARLSESQQMEEALSGVEDLSRQSQTPPLAVGEAGERPRRARRK